MLQIITTQHIKTKQIYKVHLTESESQINNNVFNDLIYSRTRVGCSCVGRYQFRTDLSHSPGKSSQLILEPVSANKIHYS